jgi:hypothetical protein
MISINLEYVLCNMTSLGSYFIKNEPEIFMMQNLKTYSWKMTQLQSTILDKSLYFKNHVFAFKPNIEPVKTSYHGWIWEEKTTTCTDHWFANYYSYILFPPKIITLDVKWLDKRKKSENGHFMTLRSWNYIFFKKNWPKFFSNFLNR